MEDEMTNEDLYSALDDYYSYKNKHDRKCALKALFKRKSFCDEWEDFRFYEKWFYWFKILICLLFDWTNGSYLDDSTDCLYWNQQPSSGEYSGYEWESLWVEHGFFKNWKVCIMSDSSY